MTAPDLASLPPEIAGALPPEIAALLDEYRKRVRITEKRLERYESDLRITDAERLEDAARAALEAEIATLAQERDELRAALAEATTPDIYGDSEGVTADADDVDVLGDGLRCGDIREVWANRTLGSRWLARLPVTFDDDGDPDEIATRIFDTKDEAVAATRAARTPTGGTPT
jgi:hypothetical protein